MGLFRAMNAKPTHMLNMRQMNTSLLSKLNPKEQDLLEPAIAYLLDHRLVELGEWMNQPSLVLTQTGYDYIYLLDEAGAVARISAGILTLFEKARARAGHGLPLRTIQFNLFDKLNPKERSLTSAAIQLLLDEELVTEQEGSLPSLVLTAAGYDKLY